MLFADGATASLQVWNLVAQGGAVGLLVIIMVWVGRYFVPELLKRHDALIVGHADAITKIVTSHEKQMERHYVIAERLATAMERLTDRVEALERRTDEHRPLRDS